MIWIPVLKVLSTLPMLWNCFQNNSACDINNQNGNIFPFQGDPFLSVAAGNCFEGNAIDINNKGGTGNLFYYVRQNTPLTSCKYPKNSALYNYSVNATMQIDPYADCAGLSPFVPENNCNISDNATISDLITVRQQIQTQLNTLTSQYSQGSTDLEYWTNAYRTCIQKIDDLIGRKSFVLGSSDPLANKEAAINYFNGCGDFMNKTTAFGIMVTFGEYNRARNYLQTLTTQNTDETNFKWVQGVNLDYLQNTFDYRLTEPNRLQLGQIGRSDGPFTGYARSLYEVLTGERIQVNFAELQEPGSGDREQVAKTETELSVSTFPNPVQNGQLRIVVYGMAATSTLRSELFDLNGRLSSYKLILTDGAIVMDVSNLPSGVYFLKVSNSDNNIQYQTKVVISD
jgi:hypothetical protein